MKFIQTIVQNFVFIHIAHSCKKRHLIFAFNCKLLYVYQSYLFIFIFLHMVQYLRDVYALLCEICFHEVFTAVQLFKK